MKLLQILIVGVSMCAMSSCCCMKGKGGDKKNCSSKVGKKKCPLNCKCPKCLAKNMAKKKAM